MNNISELYLKSDERLSEIEKVGTVICRTSVDDGGVGKYEPCNKTNRHLVVGVVSDTFGAILGGDKDKTLRENLEYYYPIALSGRVKVNVIKGKKVKLGQMLYADHDGCASTRRHRGALVGKALESSDGNKDKILVQIILG